MEEVGFEEVGIEGVVDGVAAFAGCGSKFYAMEESEKERCNEEGEGRDGWKQHGDGFSPHKGHEWCFFLVPMLGRIFSSN